MVRFQKNLKYFARNYENVTLAVRPLHPAVYGLIVIFQKKQVTLTFGVEALVSHQADV
jgi:hypothetical protein